MPKKNYTQKEFEKDLEKLEQLMQKGGEPSNNDMGNLYEKLYKRENLTNEQKAYVNVVNKGMTAKKNNNVILSELKPLYNAAKLSNAQLKSNENKRVANAQLNTNAKLAANAQLAANNAKLVANNNKLVTNIAGGKKEEKSDSESDSEEESDSESDSKDSEDQQNGGKKPYSGTYRHFKIVEVDGKQVKFGTADIKETQTPLNAAKKMLKSIAHEHNLKGNNKLKIKVVFSIQETTQGSAKKVFGPYSGKYHKYTGAEMKKATASGIKFRMKPVVKLYKGKSPMKSPMKSPKKSPKQKGG